MTTSICTDLNTLHSLDRRTSCPNTQTTKDTSACQPRINRLNSTPNFRSGIPLGSQTAQLASKSFWNPQMLQTSMEKIAQCAARESSSLVSSMESIDSSDDETFDENVVQVSEDSSDDSRSFSASHLQQFNFTLEAKENLRTRVLRHPLENTKSTPLASSRRSGESTPPYLSPGLTKKLKSQQ